MKTVRAMVAATVMMAVVAVVAVTEHGGGGQAETSAELERVLLTFADVWRGETAEEAVWDASAVVVQETEEGMVLLTAGHVAAAMEGSRAWVRQYTGQGFGELVAAEVRWSLEGGDLAVLVVPGVKGWPVARVTRVEPRRFERCLTVGQSPVGTPLLYSGEVLGRVPEVKRRAGPTPQGEGYTGCYVVSAHAYYGFSGGPALVWRGGEWAVFGVAVSGTVYGMGPAPGQVWVFPVEAALEEIEL